MSCLHMNQLLRAVHHDIQYFKWCTGISALKISPLQRSGDVLYNIYIRYISNFLWINNHVTSGIDH